MWLKTHNTNYDHHHYRSRGTHLQIMNSLISYTRIDIHSIDQPNNPNGTSHPFISPVIKWMDRVGCGLHESISQKKIIIVVCVTIIHLTRTFERRQSFISWESNTIWQPQHVLFALFVRLFSILKRRETTARHIFVIIVRELNEICDALTQRPPSDIVVCILSLKWIP